MLLPPPFAATRPIRDEPSVKERSASTGVPSGHEKERRETLMRASDMEFPWVAMRSHSRMDGQLERPVAMGGSRCFAGKHLDHMS